MRLWGRVWLGLSAAAMVAAVSGSAGSALGAGEPPVRASAQAIAVLQQGAAPEGTDVVTAFGPAAARGPYHGPDAIHAGWAMATAVKHQGALPSAEASTLLRHVRLLDGAVRVRKLWTSASLAANADGTVHDLTGGDIHGLVVLGRHVHPAAGKTLQLDDWGTLAVLTTQPTTLKGVVTTETITGLRLTLLHDHAGLAAGTVVALGTATAAVTIPPAPTGNGGGSGTGGGSGNGGAPSPPPPPKVHHPAHHHHQHPQPARHHPRHHAAHQRPVRLTQASHALINAAAGGRARVIAAALAQVGWPYIWGGDSRAEGGFDCSGLVDYAYAHAGMPLPGRPTAAVLYRMSMPVGPKHLQPGDLAFLYSRHRAPYHVALYVGDGLMVVAPHTGAKVQIEPLSSVPWDGYGRLLQGGRGDGLAHSVAVAARRFAHPGSGRLAAARRADALAARRVQSAGQRFIERLMAARVPVPTTTKPAVTPQLVSLASVRGPDASPGVSVAGAALLVLIAAGCIVRVPALNRLGRN